jgi:pilus assembly protein CpaF
VEFDAWSLSDGVSWPSSAHDGEASDIESTLNRWMAVLQRDFPDRVAHLVWDRERVVQLERALDQIVADDPCPDHLKAFYRRSIVNRLTGLGPLDPLLLDDTVTEIMVNGTSAYVERGGVIEPVTAEFYDVEEVQELARRMANRAGRALTTESPLCDAQLSDGSRIHCVLPPVSEFPSITIRRTPMHPLTVADCLAQGSFSEKLWASLASLVRERKNIIIAGGSSTGKTSLLRLMAGVIGPEERLVTIEDVRELNVVHPNSVSLEAHRQFSVRELVTSALRMRPDRIVVGEVRGAEAIDLLEAMSTGHPGSLCTLHSAGGGLRTVHRMARLALQRSVGLTFETLVAEIADTIEAVIYLVREPNGRRRVDSVTRISPAGCEPWWLWDGDQFVERVVE